MSLRPLASLAIKLLGLSAMLNALPGISSVLATFAMSRSSAGGAMPSPISFAFASLSGVVLLMAVGLGLWWFSDVIARMAVPEEGDVGVRRDEGLTAIGFSVAGAYLLSDFVVELTRFLGRAYLASQASSLFRPEESHVGFVDFLPILVRGAAALYLLLGARGLARGLTKFRDVGRDNVSREVEVEESGTDH